MRVLRLLEENKVLGIVPVNRFPLISMRFNSGYLNSGSDPSKLLCCKSNSVIVLKLASELNVPCKMLSDTSKK
jgi:hypothetical protein